MPRVRTLAPLMLSLALVPATLACKKKQPETTPVTTAPPPPQDKAAVPQDVQEMAANFSRVFFDFDSDQLDGPSKAALRSNALIMQANATIKIEIQGHADERGTTDYNLALGTRRAQAVKEYLQAEGVSPGRLQIVSYGEERPLTSGSSESAWSKNRRCEFRITWGEGATGTVQ